MKKISVLALASVALLFAACGGNSTKNASTGEEQQVAEKSGEVYAVNLETSKVDWKAFHKGGFAPRWGTIALKSGEISTAEGQLTSGDFVIDMQSIKVDTASVTEKDKKATDLEAHLKNPDFFNVEKNPTAEFKVTTVADLATAPADAVDGANKTVSGNLTLMGKTLNVTFPAKVTVEEAAVSVLAKFTVNRTDWGIKFGSTAADPAEWMISKDIEIGIDVKAAK
ncbi:YceI family protein [Pedobacter sp. AW31-3R]|uniref:YceI family protein n=1 Tax=Pedobacter sp. AW31-3R TaxID=3445781 RepID=UPI003F9F735B